MDGTAFRRVFERHCSHVEATGFDFTYCDVLADFARRAADKTEDIGILRAAVRSLAVLGCSHNRWYVRDALTALLQAVRTAEQAVAATDGLRQAGATAVRFSITDFTLRSLHPVLREGVGAYLSELETT